MTRGPEWHPLDKTGAQCDAEGFGKGCGYLSKHLSNYSLFDVAGLSCIKKNARKNVRECVFGSLTVACKVAIIKSKIRIDFIKKLDFHIGDGEYIEFKF